MSNNFYRDMFGGGKTMKTNPSKGGNKGDSPLEIQESINDIIDEMKDNVKSIEKLIAKYVATENKNGVTDYKKIASNVKKMVSALPAEYQVTVLVNALATVATNI